MKKNFDKTSGKASHVTKRLRQSSARTRLFTLFVLTVLASVSAFSSTLVSVYTTTTSVRSSLNPSNVGDRVTFTIQVNDPAPVKTADKTGWVTVRDSNSCATGTVLGTDYLNPSNKIGHVTTASLAAGVHTIIACYAGDTLYAPSSGTISQVVNGVTIPPSSIAEPTALTLSTPVSGVYGGTVNLSATLIKTADSSSVSGKAIIFKLNGAGVCGGTGQSVCPSTNANGVAALSNVSLAGINAGTYAAGSNSGVAASFVGDPSFASSSDNKSLTVTKADQSITFDALANKTFGDSAFNVTASASSGLSSSFSATGNCTNSGSTINITGAGSCTVTASQLGDNNYNAATDASQTFSIAQQATTVQLSNLSYIFDGSAKSVTATTTPNGLSVTITYSQNNQAVTAPTSIGSYAVSAIINDANYTGSGTGTLVIGSQVNARDVLINEFRFRGTGASDADSANNEFISLYNNTNSPIVVGTSDGSSGWAIAARNALATSAATVKVIPNGTSIPARGHLLLANDGTGCNCAAYSMTTYSGAADLTFSQNIEDNSGIALFKTANEGNFALATRLDAAGFDGQSGTIADLYREGTGITQIGTLAGEYSFVRAIANDLPSDTDVNRNDFLFISTTGEAFGRTGATAGADGPSILGAPGPMGLASTTRNTGITGALVPNVRDRIYTSTDINTTLAPIGTFAFQRRYTNNTNGNITRLRFRVVDTTTLNSYAITTSQQAIFRVLDRTVQTTLNNLTNNNLQTTVVVDGQTLKGLTLDQASAQGGGLNSTLSVDLPSPLAPGQSVDVQFRLGAQRSGSYRFFVIFEAQ